MENKMKKTLKNLSLAAILTAGILGAGGCALEEGTSHRPREIYGWKNNSGYFVCEDGKVRKVTPNEYMRLYRGEE